MTTQTARDSQQTNNVAPWVRRGGPAVATIALVTYVTAYAHWPTLRMQVDAMVYRFAAERLLAGLDLYSTGLTGKPGELLFIYPPFAAICALPLALLDSSAVHLLWLLGVVATLTYAVVRMLKSTGMQVAGGLFSLAALLVGVIAWLEPIRLTAELGQINLVLLALVVADLSPYASRGWAPSLRGECPQDTKQGKWTGIGVGPGRGPQTHARAVHRLPVGDPTDTCCLVGHGNVRRHGRTRIRLCSK